MGEIEDLYVKKRFYEWVLKLSAPHSHGRGNKKCKSASGEEVCCNPACRGEWGTGCWCCHHGKYATDITVEEMKAALDQGQVTTTTDLDLLNECVENALRYPDEPGRVNTLTQILVKTQHRVSSDGTVLAGVWQRARNVRDAIQDLTAAEETLQGASKSWNR